MEEGRGKGKWEGRDRAWDGEGKGKGGRGRKGRRGATAPPPKKKTLIPGAATGWLGDRKDSGPVRNVARPFDDLRNDHKSTCVWSAALSH